MFWVSSHERSSEVPVTYQAHHKHSQCQSEMKIKSITFDKISKQKNPRAIPLKFLMSTATLFSSQTKESLHSTFLGGEREKALHWKMRDFEWIQQPRRKCKKTCVRTNSCSYLLPSSDLQLCHLSETEDRASLLILEFRQSFPNSFVSISCSTSHPSLP